MSCSSRADAPTNPNAPTALDPLVVADVVASMVKRFLVNQEGAVSYAAALAELFALDPDAVEAVTRPEGV